MVAAAAAFLGAAMQVVKWVAKPIKRQFNYLCCFTSNINNLRDEAKRLGDATQGLQLQVDRATDNLQVIVPQVNTWLIDSNGINGEINGILNEATNVESGCLKLGARFSLSKSAKKTTDRSKEHRGQKNFDSISQQGPPPATLPLPGGKTYEFKSRIVLEEKIMTTLRDGDVNLIGINGMGGIGKTTMAQKLRNRVLNENVFQEVAMTVVSQQADKSKIQVEIGGSLGLHLKDDSPETRVQKLHARLSGTKRILVILDDVWEGLELEDLGIPCDSKGCTILITSRNSDALSAMGCEDENRFGMEILSEEEAWCLFREGAGTCVDDTNLNSIAKEVVKECKGLPIALKTLGLALKGKSNASSWNDALRELRQCDADIPNYIKEVYTPLKLSYDFLDSEKAKSLFLLCCLFPEDLSIPLWQLTYFCMGLGIYGGMINLEDARNKTYSLTDFLKSRSLLLDGYNEDYVRMHDVVRDVCIYIAKQKGYIGGNNCTWISSSQFVGERIELLTESIFPNLRLLYLDGLREEFKFGSAFLEGIKDLYMLCIRNYRKLTSLPPTTSSFVNLKTLILYSCDELKSISVIGKLRNLEILICRHCASIEELPLEMKGLNRLKLLELTWCYQLKSIGRGIISSLVGLEEGSFKRWEAEDREERETTRGKDCLPQLEKLHLEECRMMQQVFLWNNEEAGVNKNSIESRKNHSKVFPKLKVLELVSLPNLTTFCQGIEGIEFPLLTKLQIEECPKMKSIIIPSNEITSSSADIDDDSLHLFGQSGKVSFGSSLEVLKIDHSPFFAHEIPSSLFNGLKELTINKYVGRISLFTLSVARNLVSLRKLRIRNYDEMIKVIEDEQQQHRILLFPKLEELYLEYLPKLVSFCDWKCEVELPLLRNVVIARCPNMKSFSMGLVATPNLEAFTTDLTTYVGVGVDNVAFDSLKQLEIRWNENPFVDRKISVSLFNGLGKLIFYSSKNSMSLFSSSAAGNLVNLRVLEIKFCDEMLVKVIEDEEEKVVSGGEIITSVVIFPELEELRLWGLLKLVRFCEWKCDVELPSLREVEIRNCPNMESFSMGFIAAPNLKNVQIDGQKEIGATKDLNGALRQHYLARREKVLEINHNPFCGQEFPSLVYNRLEVLKISMYEGSMSLFTLSVAANLVSLRRLWIENCDEMIKVIDDEQQQQRILVFPKLEKLYLENLPKLVSFCSSKCEVELPFLGVVVIKRCSNMEDFSLGLVAIPNLVTFTTDLTTYVGVGVNVAFDNLKKLVIRENEIPLYDVKISVSIFNGLEELEFHRCKGCMSLFSSSAIGNLVNLRVLGIRYIDEMLVKVIEDEEKEEDKKVVSGGEIRSVVFPKLEKLYLVDLPELVRFCEWKCDVELPSLRKVFIYECPNMESFSMGSVTTPNLKMIRINDEYFDVAEELNGVVQQHLAREKSRKKKKVVQRRDETEEDDQN